MVIQLFVEQHFVNLFPNAQDQGPPDEVVEAGVFLHPCEGEAVCKLTNEKVILSEQQRWAFLHACSLV